MGQPPAGGDDASRESTDAPVPPPSRRPYSSFICRTASSEGKSSSIIRLRSIIFRTRAARNRFPAEMPLSCSL